MRLLASLGVHGNTLATICEMYWSGAAHAKVHGRLGPALPTTCGVRQGDPLSPLLFGLYIDRLEAHLASAAAGVGVPLGDLPSPLQVLLYADDLVLLARDARGLQALLDALHTFCTANGLRVNTQKTEVVVFGHRAPPRSPSLTYAGQALPVSKSFRYLGVVLHSTRGVACAPGHLLASAQRALGAMHGRCRAAHITDFALRTRLYRALVEPILTYASEVWAPDIIRSLPAALASPHQVLQNGFIRRLGGLRRSTHTLVLAAEAHLPLLPKLWLHGACTLWERARYVARGAAPTLLHLALRANLALAQSLPPERAARTWAGAFRNAHGAVAAGLPAFASLASDWWAGVQAAPRRGLPLGYAPKWGDAWKAAMAALWRAGRPGGVREQYRAHFLLRGDEHAGTPGLPPTMPWYFRHTSRFAPTELARTLMRVRCLSTPFATCPTGDAPLPVCTRCQTGEPATLQHALLDCPATAALRQLEPFVPLFMGPFPLAGRLRIFMHTPHQHTLAKYVHACLSYEPAPGSIAASAAGL
jgi:hypothetical protein